MASGHVNRVNRAEHMAATDQLHREEKPCQQGAVHTWHSSAVAASGRFGPLFRRDLPCSGGAPLFSLLPTCMVRPCVARGFVESAVSGLASMYPAFDLELEGLLAIMESSAPASSLADRPQRAIRVTRVRMRREDRTSISSHPLADLGR